MPTIDSATAANTAKIMSVNPSWSFVVLALVVGMIFIIVNLLRNTKVTEAIMDSMSTVKEIRKDQIISNNERKLLTDEVGLLRQEVSTVAERVTVLEGQSCANTTTCAARIPAEA